MCPLVPFIPIRSRILRFAWINFIFIPKNSHKRPHTHTHTHTHTHMYINKHTDTRTLSPAMASRKVQERDCKESRPSKSKKVKNAQRRPKWKIVIILAAFMALALTGFLMASLSFWYISLLERFPKQSTTVVCGALSLFSGARFLSGKLNIYGSLICNNCCILVEH